MERKRGWNVLYIRRYDVTHVEFKTLHLYNIVKSHQNATSLCTRIFSANSQLFNVNNRNIRKMWERCSQWRWRRSGVFIVNFEHILHVFLVFLLVTLNKQMLAGFLLNPIQDEIFRCCSRMGRGAEQKDPLALKSVRHILQWWNLPQLYLTQRRSKKHMNHLTNPLSSADISIFSPEISKFCYIKKYRYRLQFDT